MRVHANRQGRKRKRICVLLAWIGYLVLGCAGTVRVAKAAGGEIYVASPADEWPFSYYDRSEGAYQGILVDLLDEMGRQKGVLIRYIRPKKQKNDLELAKNIQVDAVWVMDPDKREMEQNGLVPGTISIVYEQEQTTHRIVLCYTKSMDAQMIEHIEDAYAMLSPEDMQGLFLKHGLRYKNSHRLYSCLMAVSVVAAVVLLTAVYLWGFLGRKQYAKKLKAYEEQIPDVDRWLKYAQELVTDQNRVNYAIVRIAAGLEQASYVYGYEDASQVMQQLLDILKPYVEQGREIVAKSGEFELLLLMYGTQEEQYMERIKHIFGEMEQRFLEQKKAYQLKLRSGICHLTAENADIKEALGASMAALAYAGETSGECVLYDPNMRKKLAADYEMEYDAARALKEHEFMVYLQPLVDPKTGVIKGAETLVRWKNQKRGLLAPNEFLGVMKRTHLLGNLNMEVYCQGCQVLREELRKERPIGMLFHFTIDNVEDQDFADHLDAVAEQYGIDRRWIGIELDEITDTSYERVLQKMIAELKEYGFHVFINGLNLESAFLQYMHGNIDGVKFGYDVIKHLELPGAKETFEKSVALCQSMDLAVICCGVENENQRQMIAELGCDMASGYYFYYPVAAEAFHEIMDESCGAAVCDSDR